MAHPEQINFIKCVLNSIPKEFIINSNLLEIGSYDNNGTVRDLFPVKKYIGADLVSGPGVDLIYDGLILETPLKEFDIVLSCECFEHDPNWVNTFNNMIQKLCPNGILIFSCASKGRLEHGTLRTNIKDSPGTTAIGINYYRNLRKKDFLRNFKFNKHFHEFFFFHNTYANDLYFVGVKNSDSYKKIIDIPYLKLKLKSNLKTLRIAKKENPKEKLFRILFSIDYPIRELLLLEESEKTYQNYMFLKNKMIKKLSKLTGLLFKKILKLF